MGILLVGRGKGGRGALSLSSVSPFKCFLLLLPLLAAGSLLLATSVAASAANKYDTSPRQRKDGVLNVHLVCHTHDDVGWLKTLDQFSHSTGFNLKDTLSVSAAKYTVHGVIIERDLADVDFLSGISFNQIYCVSYLIECL